MSTSLSMAAPWWRPNTGDRLVIRGGRPLVGRYPISGAKNAVLPLMVSALLTPHLVTLHNVPASGNAADEVPGVVFRITPAELAAADTYEVSDYKRIAVRMKSG